MHPMKYRAAVGPPPAPALAALQPIAGVELLRFDESPLKHDKACSIHAALILPGMHP